MSKTEGDPGFTHRLRFELDRIQPRNSPPRYAAAPRQHVAGWRFAPVALVISVGGLVALTATVATGTPNPVVWTERVVTTIHPEPAASPAQEQHQAPAAAPTDGPDHASSAPSTQRAEPSDRPEPTESPEPKDSPEPSDSPRHRGDH